MASLKLLIVVAILIVIACTECKGGRGGGRGGGFRSGGYRSSSSRTSSSGRSWFSSSRRSSSVATSRPATSYNSYSSRSSDSNSNSYGARKATSVVTNKPPTNHGPQYYGSNTAHAAGTATRKSSSGVQTTPRTYADSNKDTSYSGSTYYGGYHRRYRNRKNNTGVEQYPPQVYHNGYYQQSSGVGNVVLAGLGGSALGMFLGYQLGSMSNPSNSGYDNSFPRYSVVHHYHHGENAIVKNAKIEENVITQCSNITFCTPNTTPLCLTNGTIYCLAPMNTAISCSVNSSLHCIKTTLAAPCLNDTAGNCSDTSPLKNMTAEIPCLTNLYVMGDFTTGKLKVYQAASVRSFNSSSSVTNSNSTSNSTGVIVSINSTETIINPIVDTNFTVDSNSNSILNTSLGDNPIGNTNNSNPIANSSSSVDNTEGGGVNSTENTNITSPIVDNNSTVVNATTDGDNSTANVNITTPIVDINSTVSSKSNSPNTNVNATDTSIDGNPTTTISPTTTTATAPTHRPSILTTNEFCVVVIANPVTEPPFMTNAQFVDFVSKNDEAKKEAYAKFEMILAKLLH